MTKSRKVRIVWQSTRGTRHSKMVVERCAQAVHFRLRRLPDVKSNTVRMSL